MRVTIDRSSIKDSEIVIYEVILYLIGDKNVKQELVVLNEPILSSAPPSFASLIIATAKTGE